MYSLWGLPLLLFSLASASIFTQNNRYELSYDYIKATADTVSDTTATPFFSVPEQIDLQKGDKRFLSLVHDDQSISFTPYLSLFSETSGENTDIFTSLHARGTYSSSFLKAYIDIHAYTTRNSATSTSNEFSYERFIRSDEHVPIEGFMDFRVNLPEAYIEASYKNLTLQTGKRKLRWGPGYKGTLGMSGTSYSPFFLYHLQLEFGELLHLSSFLCSYDDPYHYRDELDVDTTLKIANNNKALSILPPRYSAGQRINVRLGKYVQIGIYELVTFFGMEDFTHFANPLQIYYLGNQASGTNSANLLGGMDFNILLDRFRIYGEFLNDDITMFEDKGNPDKYALQLGMVHYPNSRVVAAGVEYTHISPYVYGHSRVLSRHALWGESLGWPYGNDQDVVTGYCIFDLGPALNARAELSYWLRGSGTLKSDWYADGRPDLDHAPYFPRNAQEKVSAYLSAEYRPLNWLRSSIVYRPSYSKGKFKNALQGSISVGVPKSVEYDQNKGWAD
ncbi:MAG: capsule assembly Wzi family protein [Chitinispirillaceae bacterium]